jgi:hypothetical protein
MANLQQREASLKSLELKYLELQQLNEAVTSALEASQRELKSGKGRPKKESNFSQHTSQEQVEAQKRSKELEVQLEMVQRVSEERAQQLEQSLAAQRKLKDEVERLSLLQGWQQDDSVHAAPSSPTFQEERSATRAVAAPRMTAEADVLVQSLPDSPQFQSVEFRAMTSVEEGVMQGLHNDRERVDVLTARIKDLETELVDLNEEHVSQM